MNTLASRASKVLSLAAVAATLAACSPKEPVAMDSMSASSAMTVPSPAVGTKNAAAQSRIAKIVNAHPDFEGSKIPTGVSPVGQWAIGINSFKAYNFDLQKVTVQVDATNVSLATDGFKFYNKDYREQQDQRVAGKILNLNGTPYKGGETITGSFLVEVNLAGSTIDRQIPPSSERHFVLEANVINPKISGAKTSTLQMVLVTDGTKFGWSDTDHPSMQYSYASDTGDTIFKSVLYKN